MMAKAYGLDAASIQVLRKLVADEVRRNRNPTPKRPQKRQRPPGTKIYIVELLTPLHTNAAATANPVAYRGADFVVNEDKEVTVSALFTNGYVPATKRVACLKIGNTYYSITNGRHYVRGTYASGDGSVTSLTGAGTLASSVLNFPWGTPTNGAEVGLLWDGVSKFDVVLEEC